MITRIIPKNKKDIKINSQNKEDSSLNSDI